MNDRIDDGAGGIEIEVRTDTVKFTNRPIRSWIELTFSAPSRI